ncbi:MAG: hypothetical protein SGJ21_07245 [Alphaproteobacteria bacterium]|nr:hypothetical protein [Alphaproteobacteria bacterium]
MSAPETFAIEGASAGIWRAAPSLNGARTAAVGAFACETAKAGAGLLQHIAEKMRSEGFGAVLGPMDGDTWGRHRLVVESDGRAPFLMEPSNPACHVEAFELAGWSVVSRYLSAERPADVLASATAAPPGLRLRTFEPARAKEELAQIHRLSLETFSANAFYAPISFEAFFEAYRPVLAAIDPGLVLLAEDGDGALQAFLFAIPNLAEGPGTRTVILKTYASRVKGGGSMLANAFHERARDRGFGTVIHALMHDSNLSARHSGNTDAKVFRRYALWGQVF